MNKENLIKLAKQNLDCFHNESDLAEYIAFLFSELAKLDSEWEEFLIADISGLES
jgi:hypothetical protein